MLFRLRWIGCPPLWAADVLSDLMRLVSLSSTSAARPNQVAMCPSIIQASEGDAPTLRPSLAPTTLQLSLLHSADWIGTCDHLIAQQSVLVAVFPFRRGMCVIRKTEIGRKRAGRSVSPQNVGPMLGPEGLLLAATSHLTAACATVRRGAQSFGRIHGSSRCGRPQIQRSTETASVEMVRASHLHGFQENLSRSTRFPTSIGFIHVLTPRAWHIFGHAFWHPCRTP